VPVLDRNAQDLLEKETGPYDCCSFTKTDLAVARHLP